MPSPSLQPLPPDLLPRMSLPRRPDLDPRGLLAALDPGLSGASLRELGEGWDNVAHRVGDDLLLRVSKKTDPGDRSRDVERDVALLAFAQEHSSLLTNRVVASDPAAGALLMTLVPGPTMELVRPGDPSAFASTMAVFLSRLHSVPLDLAREVAAPSSALAAWFAETQQSWTAVADRFEPEDRRAVDEFLQGPLPTQPDRMVFCHNDLWEQHLVADAETANVIGVIDWSDAILGDPARDLALLWLDFGTGIIDRVMTDYAGPVDGDLRRRAWWHAVHAGIEGVAHRCASQLPSLPTSLDRLRHLLVVGDGS